MTYKLPKPMGWNVWVARRRLDAASWISSMGFTKQSLLQWCDANNVEHPSQDELAVLFPRKTKKPVASKPEKQGKEKVAQTGTGKLQTPDDGGMMDAPTKEHPSGKPLSK